MTLKSALLAACGVSAGAPPAATDPYFRNVSLLLNDTGTNGAQNNTFVDSSTNNFTITRTGTPTQGSFSPYGDLWSNNFNGSTDRLGISHNTALDLSTGSWTIEGWMYVTSGTYYRTMVAKRVASGATCEWEFGVSNSNTLYFYRTGTAVNGSTTVPSNTWVHAAVTYDGTNLRMFQNGTVVYTQSGLTAASGTNNVTVGNYGASGDQPWFGSISNLRVVKGTALYTSAFTPSTTPLTAVSGTSLLTCQSNRFRDNSSNNFAITVTGTPSVQRFSPFDPAASYSAATYGGSGYFNGSTDYLTSSGSTATAVSTGDFCVELFTFYTSYPAQYTTIFSTKPSNLNTATGYGIGVENVGNIYNYSNAYITKSANSVFQLNVWNHVVFTRSGTTARLFLNGVLVATGTNSQDFSNQAFSIGSHGNGVEKMAGYVSNVRMVKGSIPTAYQTSSTTVGAVIFIPPTAPVTAITGTSLLLNCTNAGIYDAATLNDLVTVGDAKVSTAQAKFGSSSMAFDGTGDYLSTPTSPSMNFGTGDFTVEAWVYPTALSSDWFISSASGSGGFFFGFSSTTIVGYGWGRAGVAWDYRVASTATANTWQHVAVTRSGTSMRLFVNGVQQGTTQTISTAYNMGATSTTIGSQGANYYLNGYLDDLRVTKGYARYTANFTTPTAPFPTR